MPPEHPIRKWLALGESLEGYVAQNTEYFGWTLAVADRRMILFKDKSFFFWFRVQELGDARE
jgi:hypothetical protein